jgi:hypothetical protein
MIKIPFCLMIPEKSQRAAAGLREGAGRGANLSRAAGRKVQGTMEKRVRKINRSTFRVDRLAFPGKEGEL